MIYYCDDKRHLICVPYSIENLHKMAEQLGIKRCWYHGGKKPHYDIPKKDKKRIAKETLFMHSKEIVKIIKETIQK